MQANLTPKPETSKSHAAPEPKEAPELATAPAAGARAGAPHFLLQSSGGPSPVQRKEADAFRFPYMEQIHRSLEVSLPLAAVHDEPGCARRGTVAFTDGTVTHFASKEPDLDVAAHEAAHQLQNMGVTRDAGLGPEGHAVAVAGTVREGRSAGSLIGSSGEHVPGAVRGYVETDKYGGWGRLGETGDTLTFKSHEAYATPALIAQANGILKARKSGVEISAGAGAKTVDVPGNGGSKTLSKVDVKFAVDPKAEKFYSDCRQAAREVMGHGPDKSEAAVGRPGGVPLEISPIEGALELVALTIYIDKTIREAPGYEKMTEEEKQAIAKEARARFEWLSPKEKEKLKKTPLDQKHAEELGIDQSALPEVGEAYAAVSGEPPKIGQYFFHYAAVIMAAGPDRVTLENAGGAKGEMTGNWKMQTYGPASKRQTFQDAWGGYLGNYTHTLRVRTQPIPPGDVEKFPAMFTGQLLERYRKSTDADERFYLKNELDKRKFYALVEAVQQKSRITADDVYLLFSGISTGSVTFANGTSHIFEVPLTRLWPVADPLYVDVFQLNLLLADDLLGVVKWPSPYLPKSEVELRNGDAHYKVTLTT